MRVRRLKKDLTGISLAVYAAIRKLIPTLDPGRADEFILRTVIFPSVIECAAHMLHILAAIDSRFIDVDESFENERGKPTVFVIRILSLYDLRIGKVFIRSLYDRLIAFVVYFGKTCAVRLFRINLIELCARRHMRSRIIRKDLRVDQFDPRVARHIFKAFF